MRDGSESPAPADNHEDAHPRAAPPKREDEPEETSARVPLDPILASVATHATEFGALAAPGQPAPVAMEPASETATEKPRVSFAALREEFQRAAEGMTPAHVRAIRVATYMQAKKAEETAAQRRQRTWFGLILALALLALAVLAVRANARKEAAQTAAMAPAVAPAPSVRPPYNPTLHGSVEEFRATYGHLPPPDSSARRHAPSTLGLDRRGARITGLYASGADEQDEREARERARRGW